MAVKTEKRNKMQYESKKKLKEQTEIKPEGGSNNEYKARWKRNRQKALIDERKERDKKKKKKGKIS